MTRLLDMRGRNCPEPVIETRKALLDDGETILDVVVDNEAASENITRLIRSLGGSSRVLGRSDGIIKLQITAADTLAPESTEEPDGSCRLLSKNVVLLNSDSIGPSAELGRTLMKAFINTLPDVPPLPEVVILLNSGVKLAVEHSDLLGVLTTMEAAGTTVLSCGTCLDYFELTDKLRVGKITNMFEVVSLLAGADRIIKP